MKNRTAHVVIVGGGFAGVKVARELRDEGGVHVTLISDYEEFRYSPALYRTATGHMKRESSIPIASLFDGSENITFKKARIVSIDRKKRVIVTNTDEQINYDYCVLALGVVTSFFGIPGLEKYSYSIKSGREVEQLKRHLHRELIDEHALDKNYVIVGAGPTGVELAGALGQYLARIRKSHSIPHGKITIELIEAADRVLPAMKDRASRLATKRLEKLHVNVMTGRHVKGEAENSLNIDGRSIPTHTVIWTAGVTNNPFYKRNIGQFTLNEKGRVQVDEYFRVDEHCFVAGDNAAVPFSGLALSAIRNARYISDAIMRSLENRNLKPARFKDPAKAVPLGTNNALFQWKFIVFSGPIGGLLRLAADLIGYSDIMGIRKATAIWLKRDEYEETCPVCRAPHSDEKIAATRK